MTIATDDLDFSVATYDGSHLLWKELLRRDNLHNAKFTFHFLFVKKFSLPP